MAVRTSRAVIYHIARTGGIWIKVAIHRSGLRYDRCKHRRGAIHEFGLVREHATPDMLRPEDKEGLFSICFVRHPVNWVKSFWAFRVRTGYLDMKFPLDRIWNDDLEKFVANILSEYPEGFVTRLYQYYIGEKADRLDFIGRQENLVDDLVQALTLAGEEFDEVTLRATGRKNAAASSPRFAGLCLLSQETTDRILEAEGWVLDNFYGT